ncbi:hypothetical protein AAIA72_11635 [Hahella sp. SMD15-11]|uniref:Uncharacterized protein n=1 Tax=Thermohahella caldifontis TaxID=3142973 RepID=A0AB39UTJ8_9GAMM
MFDSIIKLIVITIIVYMPHSGRCIKKAALAATAVGYLTQAGILPWMPPLWDTSNILSEKSVVGQLLHILVGYQARPNLPQVGAYLATLVIILFGMKWAGQHQAEGAVQAA